MTTRPVSGSEAGFGVNDASNITVPRTVAAFIVGAVRMPSAKTDPGHDRHAMAERDSRRSRRMRPAPLSFRNEAV